MSEDFFICEVCGDEYPISEQVDGRMCLNCASSLVQDDGIDLGIEVGK